MDTVKLETARRNMVEYQIRCCKVLDSNLIDVLVNSPREQYVPEHVRSLAYMEGSVPLPCKQEMLTPLQEAQILQALSLKGNERVLEVGTGTGYLTSLLAMHADKVISLEIHQELVDLAKANLSNNGVTNAEVLHINAMDKDAVQSSNIGKVFDVVVIGSAVEVIPNHIMELVSENGQLIAFVGTDIVTLEHHQLVGGTIIKRGITETRLLPVDGVTKAREFVF